MRDWVKPLDWVQHGGHLNDGVQQASPEGLCTTSSVDATTGVGEPLGIEM
jgi:hypothetical protein